MDDEMAGFVRRTARSRSTLSTCGIMVFSGFLGRDMPIYEYRCDSCGFQKEFIQRMSDARLTDCPACGKSTLNKMVTAAGFQLKGSGWYATDFRGNGSGPAKNADKPSDNAKSGDAAPAASTTPASEKSADKPAAKTTETKAAAPTTPAPPAASTSSS
jgi:putative FmdB family regulatory protein